MRCGAQCKSKTGNTHAAVDSHSHLPPLTFTPTTPSPTRAVSAPSRRPLSLAERSPQRISARVTHSPSVDWLLGMRGPRCGLGGFLLFSFWKRTTAPSRALHAAHLICPSTRPDLLARATSRPLTPQCPLSRTYRRGKATRSHSRLPLVLSPIAQSTPARATGSSEVRGRTIWQRMATVPLRGICTYERSRPPARCARCSSAAPSVSYCTPARTTAPAAFHPANLFVRPQQMRYPGACMS